MPGSRNRNTAGSAHLRMQIEPGVHKTKNTIYLLETEQWGRQCFFYLVLYLTEFLLDKDINTGMLRKAPAPSGGRV